MKKLFVCVLVLICLSGCGAASAPGGSGSSCDQGVCVRLSALEPIKYGNPVFLTITVTSDKDQKIGVALQSFPNVIFEEAKDNVVTANTKDKGILSWEIQRVKANTPVTFSVSVSMPEETLYHFTAFASTVSVKASDGITIQYFASNPKVYMEGTPISGTPGPVAPYRGPTLTYRPTETVFSPTFIAPTPKSTPSTPPGLSASATPNAPAMVPSVTPTLPAYPASGR